MQCCSGYTTSYAYNFAGELTQITYPSGHVVQQAVDPVGRLCAVAASATNCTSFTSPFATGLAYSASGQLTDLKYGNGVYASYGYNANLQLNCLDYSTTSRSGACTHDGTTKFGLNYSYPASPGNNGLVSSISDYMDSGRNATYAYDSLSRLYQAQTAGSTNFPAWGLQQTYDRYGNRWAQAAMPNTCVSVTCPQPSVTVSATTNRLGGSPYAYDSSGNMTDDGINTLVYDAENHAVSAANGSAAGSYVYDGNGSRVQRCLPSCSPSSNPNTVYIFSGSKVIAEYDNGAAVGSPSREYIYSGATLVAKIDSSGTRYYHQDHLSNRLITDSGGNTLIQQGHFPFGENWYAKDGSGNSITPDKWQFTTYERDSESGNDYAQARYNVSGLARFSSPDPIPGSTTDPQSLNRYSYVRNMPVTFVDPPGTCRPVVQNRDANDAEDARSGGPNATDSANSAAPDSPAQAYQGTCPNTAPWYYTVGGGNGVSIDGGEIFDPSDGASGLTGSGESNGPVPSGGGAGGWIPDGKGGYYNPITGCYTNRGSIICNWQGYDETFGAGGSSAGDPNALLPDPGTGSGGVAGGPQPDKRRATGDCISNGLEQFFGANASVGGATVEIGGHWNFPVQLQFSSYNSALAFTAIYNTSAAEGWAPAARFGDGPAIHLENLGAWSVSDNGYSIGGTAHIDLYNPDDGSAGAAGHVGVDGVIGHLVQALGGDIDPTDCPWKSHK